MRLNYLLEEELNSLKEELKECEQILKDAPEGHVEINRGENRCFYNQVIFDHGVQHKKGITKNEELIKELVKKDYYLAKQKIIKNNIKAITDLQKHYCVDLNEDALSSFPAWKQEITRGICPRYKDIAKAWAAAIFPSNTYKAENKTISTISGIKVRSKSEREIANCLTRAGIYYRYECQLEIGESVLYPDFTILNPKDGRLYYWEHLGMLDDPAYNQHNQRRIEYYANLNIFPEDNLILTGETKDRSLSTEEVEKVIERYFL